MHLIRSAVHCGPRAVTLFSLADVGDLADAGANK